MLILSRHDLYGLPPLHTAAAQGDVAEVTRLLAEEGLEVRAAAGAGAYQGLAALRDLTPLMVAAGSELGSAAVVRALLAHGANPRAVSAAGVDALWYAAGSGDADRVALLLAAGGRPGAVAGDGRGTAALAARAGGAEALHLVLDAGASPHPPDDVAGEAIPLFAAAAAGSAACVRQLLAAGARATLRDGDGRTALTFAAGPEVVPLLLAAGCPRDDRDRHGANALDTALGGHRLFYLAAMRDDPECGDLRQLEPAIRRRQAAVVAALLDAGMDPEGPDPDGRTALIGYALASHVHADLVRLLLARGARAQAQDARGMTALHALAHNRGQLEETASVSRLLTAAGLPVDVRDHRGRTPLHWAAAPESGNRRAIPVLLDLGADVEARDADGLTPLLLAVGIPANAFPIVRYLLDRGANPRAAAPDGRTAADLVARRVAELEAQAATPDPVPGDPAQARAAAARQRMEVRMARMTLRALDGLDPRPPVAALPVDLPEPLWLGYRSRPRRGPITPGVLETAHVEEVCSYGHACWTEGVNQAACFPTPEAIPEGFQEGDDGAPAEVYAYRAFPLLFDANGETRPLTAAELLGSEVPPPKVPDLARFTRLGYDVTECANGASPWAGCSPLSPYCNGLYWGVSALINRHCLVEDLATAGDLAVAFGVSQPEPGPYLIVEVWRAAGC